MEKEFVSYEQAAALKELGFNHRTFYAYYKDTGTLLAIGTGNTYDTPAPLKQQVFRWFREKYNADFYISRSLPNVINKDIYFIVLNDKWVPNDSYKNYEDAENRLIDNLIELTKQQDND